MKEELIKKMALTAQGSIVPLTSFMGGMVAQECLKAISGKYTPLNQWVTVKNFLNFVDLLGRN